jgi:hypothetical protein
VSDPSDINEERVRALAAAAALPLGAEREALVAAQLREWLSAADELNRKMSAPEHWAVVPVTVFAHPDVPGGEE